MSRSDLYVEAISDALEGRSVDVIVAGSIGAVESVRFVRALRRLGGDVHVCLTQGGRQFITETALSWASARAVTESFSGAASHIALHDACIVAPASANLISKAAQGITDSPATALLASYLGQGKPIIIVPNMHDSLFLSPFVQENLQRLRSFCHILDARTEEGKQKFPEPKLLADRVAHLLNSRSEQCPTLISMGTTRGFIDDVRYVSNYSSGALGTAIAEELYRQGHDTYVVSGPCPIQPNSFHQLTLVETNEELEKACHNALETGAKAAVLAASVLDFIPENRHHGKLSSRDELRVAFTKTKKIIADLHPQSHIKVGFKLEADLGESRARELAKDYMERYGLSMMILNALKDVNQSQHRAQIAEKTLADDGSSFTIREIEGKKAIAAAIAKHLAGRYKRS